LRASAPENRADRDFSSVAMATAAEADAASRLAAIRGAIAAGCDLSTLPARFSAAFAALGGGEVRKTRAYCELQVEEARVMM
jgi:hypothetical protein